MIRIHVICEGQTEETFVNEILVPAFHAQNIVLIPALIGRPGHKGGNLSFDRLLQDIRIRLRNDQTAYCTSFFDFYGLPGEFPGKQEAERQNTPSAKAQCLLNALMQQLKVALGPEPLRRFIPYVQMYEFEGLLFSDPERLARGICQSDLSGSFQKIRKNFASPEDINDSPETAPSKRIKRIYPAYDKPVHGSLAALEIGLTCIRSHCPGFDAWLTKLGSLGQPNTP